MALRQKEQLDRVGATKSLALETRHCFGGSALWSCPGLGQETTSTQANFSRAFITTDSPGQSCKYVFLIHECRSFSYPARKVWAKLGLVPNKVTFSLTLQQQGALHKEAWGVWMRPGAKS